MVSDRRELMGRRVGELATATGLTVRTLHYYEEIGLLAASSRTAAGHRLYDDADVERLYRICLLRRLGLPLGEIGQALDDPAWSLHAAMATHLREVERRLESANRLRSRLAGLVAAIGPPARRSADGRSVDRLPADERSDELALQRRIDGDSPPTDDRPTDDRHRDELPVEELLGVLEEMTMLDATVQRRISILVYADLEAAYEFLSRVFGLGPGELTRDGEGRVVHGELQVGDGVVWLHLESPTWGLASPRSLGAATASTAVMVDDVDAHFRHAREMGATIDYEPVDQPYGYREYSARDSEGGLWSFMRPLD